jgi:hypothetical protein
LAPTGSTTGLSNRMHRSNRRYLTARPFLSEA